MKDFLHTNLPHLNKRVHRVGLALNFGADQSTVEAAFERGINYVFYTSLRTGKALPALTAALARDRESYVVAAGPSVGYFGGSVRRAAEKTLKKLGTDYIDVFHLFWVGKGSAWSGGTLEAMQELKEQGKVRAFGISIHDRPRAAELAASVDLLMIRYNAAHPGAEREIFPSLDKLRPERKAPAVVAYTATSWRRLLKTPSGWDGPRVTAADCYRFCLSSEYVDMVLMGPANSAQLRENLEGLDKGPLSAEEQSTLRALGQRTG